MTLLRKLPASPFLHYHAGMQRYNRGEALQAAVLFKKAYARVPPAASYRKALIVHYAKALKEANKEPVAEKLLRNESGRYPEDAQLQLMLAKLLREKGYWREALSVLETFIKHSPASEPPGPDPHTCSTWCALYTELGSILLQIGNHDLAVSTYRRAVRICPDSLEALNGYAEALYLQRRSDPDSLYRSGFLRLAAQGLAKLQEEGRLDAESQFMLAELHYDHGDFDRALQLFEQLAHDHPDDARAHAAAASCYLEIANGLLLSGMENGFSHPQLYKDLEAIENCRQLMAGIPWHTVWNTGRRRNAHAGTE